MRIPRKLILFIATLAIVLVFLMPGILGWTMERKLKDLAADPGQVSAGFSLSQTRHERHWWHSDVALRIREEDPLTGELFYDITLDGTLNHGPILWPQKKPGLLGYQGGLRYQNETFRSPAIGSVDLKLSYLIALVGSLVLEPQDILLGNHNLALSGGDATLDYGFLNRHLHLDLELQQLHAPENQFQTQGGNLIADLKLSDAGIWLGTLTTAFETLNLGQESFASSQGDLRITENDGAVAYDLSIELADEGNVVYGPGQLALKIDALDGVALGQILAINAALKDVLDPLENSNTCNPPC